MSEQEDVTIEQINARIQELPEDDPQARAAICLKIALEGFASKWPSEQRIGFMRCWVVEARKELGDPWVERNIQALAAACKAYKETLRGAWNDTSVRSLQEQLYSALYGDNPEKKEDE